MMNNLNLLKPAAIFASVVHEGSFRSAAKKLGLSPSVVSQAVSALEASLGTQLLYRSTRKLTLTEAGAAYFKDVAAALERMDGASRTLRDRQSGQTGRLRISAPTILASPRFATYLRLYHEQNTGVSIEVDLSDDLRDPIDEGYDLIVRIAPLDEVIKGAELMFRTSGIICTGKRFKRQVASPDDLINLCWIKTPTMSRNLTITDPRRNSVVSLTPENQMVVNSGQLVRELVEEGVGFAVFPDFAIEGALHAKQMFNVLPGWQAGERGLFAVHSARNAKLSIARLFVENWRAYLNDSCGSANPDARSAFSDTE